MSLAWAVKGNRHMPVRVQQLQRARQNLSPNRPAARGLLYMCRRTNLYNPRAAGRTPTAADLAYVVMAYTVMTCIVVACIGIAYTFMTYIVMALSLIHI